MTSKPKCFQNFITIKPGLPEFHKITRTVLKTYLRKQNPELIVYQKYKNYDDLFREEFLSKLKNLLPNEKILKGFEDSCLQILNSLAPLKTKYVKLS